MNNVHDVAWGVGLDGAENAWAVICGAKWVRIADRKRERCSHCLTLAQRGWIIFLGI